MAVGSNVLPASYAQAQESEVARLDALRVQATASAPYIRGKTPVSDLLAAGSVSSQVKTAFLSAYAAMGGRLGPTWKALRANKNLSKADLATLNTTLSLGELLTGNLPLINDTLQRLSQKTLARVSDLAILDQNDWIARITSIDPQARSIPQVLPNETPAQRIARFAKVLAGRFAGRYPTAAFVGGLIKAQTSSFTTKAELVSVLSANPSLNLARTNIDQYLAKNKVKISALALAELKTAQRLQRLSPHYSSIEALNSAGYKSAKSVYFAGRGPFIEKMTQALGSASLAKMAYARAQMTYATALTIYGQFNQAINYVGTAVIASSAPDPGTVANFPDVQTLFGSQDYFACQDCQSITSPAAYLVDLLEYLKQFTATPLVPTPPFSQITNARDAFLFRRPEVQYIALDCNNTNTTLPYIDLVNEILEGIIAPPPPPPPPPPPYTTPPPQFIIETLGTSAERRAIPQNVSQDAYKKTARGVFPLTLPFDLPFAQTTAYLAAMGMPRPVVMALFAGAPHGPTAADIACASLGINPEMHDVIVGAKPYQPSNQPWLRWGFTSQNPTVVDPETRIVFTPADWIAALSQAGTPPAAPVGGGVPVLLSRSGLSLPQLYQLLEVSWMAQSPVTLQLGVDPNSGLVSASRELMSLNGVTSDILDRAQRFLRLLNATGLQMWELDWALGNQPLDDNFLVFIAGAIAVKNQLNLPLQEVLSFWKPLETRDVTNCLGDDPTVVPSTYGEVFANPTVFASWSSVFPRKPDLNKRPIIPTQVNPTNDQSANLNATSAALGLSASDIAIILATTSPATPNGVLTLDTINTLLRYQRLATSLSLSVSDLVLWIQLTGGAPFGTSPADMIEFLRRLAVLQGTGLGVHDLDYLLRNQSATQTSLAFTTQQSTALLQTIATAIGKLTAKQQADAPTVSAIFVAALATATNVTADVVTPVLNNTGVLPLSAATIQLLLQKPTVDPTKLSLLVKAFVTVAKAAALYTALKTSTAEFTFVVQHATKFGWLDPSALPASSTSPYAAFEALVRATKLNQRQPATAPKLFDVLGQWLLPGQLPTSVPAALAGTAKVPSLALALSKTVSDPNAISAAVSDATATAASLGAAAPSFSPAAQPGSLADMAMLTSIANALDMVARYKTPGGTLVSLASSNPAPGTAQAAFGAFQAQYPQSAWFGAVQPVEDNLRQVRRDALVAYLLGPGANLVPPYTFITTDDIYDYFLIDPEMCACALSTRLLQASLAIQQFVQQCFLNLTILWTVDTQTRNWDEWTWRQQYRLWQANLECFIHTENYVLPEIRKNKSPFFSDMESDLRQGACNEDLAETALQNYLRKLVDVSNLVVAAHYNDTPPGGPAVLHVFAHTRGDPWKWYYRTRTTAVPGAGGAWSAWQALKLDIKSDQVVPVIWDRRLHLVWLIFKPESEKQRDQSVPSSGGGTQPAPAKFWSVDVAMSELSAGQWQPKRVLTEKMFFTKNIPGISVDLVDRPQVAFTLEASADLASNLVIWIYYNLADAERNCLKQCIQAISDLAIAQENYDITFAKFLTGQQLLPDPKTALNAAQAAVNAAQIAVDSALELVALFGNVSGETIWVATVTLSMPESPAVVVQDWRLLPDSKLVDLSQEPTRALVTTTTLMGSLSSPANYNFSAQDLVCGYYYTPNPGSVSLSVLCQNSPTQPAVSTPLLGTISNPRILIPHWGFTAPFFVVDGGGGDGTSSRPTRTYLVEPEYFTVSSYPQRLDNLAYVNQWTTEYQFYTFYHPFARTMLREFELGGVPQLMSRNLQTKPYDVRGWTFDFITTFQPQPPVAMPYPGQPDAAGIFADIGESGLDFSAGCTGAYSLYNWEAFYFCPMYIASLLAQNLQWQDAMNWCKYIVNFTDSSTWPAPQRYWQMAPFFQMNANTWLAQQIQNILENIAQGTADSDTQASVYAYLHDPFNPHAIASLRISAYAKAAVTKTLDIILAQADSIYSTNYTAEGVGQAEQLYILADMILGPKPVQVPPPATSTATTPATYAQIEWQLSTESISDPLVTVENLIVAPIPPSDIIEGTSNTPTLPQFPVAKGIANGAFLFCIPPNQQLLSYWDIVADRLYKIRHCMNIQGQVVPLPLYAPPINPLLAAQMAAAGQQPSGLTPPAPIYRFATYLQKAIELVNDVRSFGALILSALEKKDAEALAVLRANQELDIQTRILDVKTQQVTEATDQITALQNQQAISRTRYNFYSTQKLTNSWEDQALKLQTAALQANALAIPLDIVAMEANMIPTFSTGVAGMGGTPEVSASFGGGQLAGAANAAASIVRATAGLLSESGAAAATVGGYQHRMDDWNLQAQVAQAEITQIQSQITAATDRQTIANSELNIQNAQINNAQAISDFLTNKYTNADLYDWMVTQLTTVYTQAFQLAYGLAQQAEGAYQFELGSQDTFLQPTYSYSDAQHRGLTAGESLLFDLRRMEAQYLAANTRELELTKHVSLALTQPMALVQLIETGTCQIYLDEKLFDLDHPGQIFRRLRSVAVTIPGISGPYTSVNANLTLATAVTRTTSVLSGAYVPASAQNPPQDPATFTVFTYPQGATISTSSGRNDAGLFEVNLRDERWLPFEGYGAVSAWALELNPATNNFDFSSITDVILHVRYTARPGIAESVVLPAIAPASGVPRAILVSVKSTFGDALYQFFNPTDPAATQQVLTVPITPANFPWSNIHSPQITDIQMFFALSQVPSTNPQVNSTFGPKGGAASHLTFTTTLPWGGTAKALWTDFSLGQSSLPPQTFTLTVPTAGLPKELTTTTGPVLLDPTKIEDIILVIRYVS
jgi:hypothetical protein